VHLILPLEAGTVTDSIALDAGDNNAGEVAGLLQALRLVEQARERGLISLQVQQQEKILPSDLHTECGPFTITLATAFAMSICPSTLQFNRR
jgi:hypothetical protein